MSTPIDSPSVTDAPTPAPGTPGGGDGSPVLFDDAATPTTTGALGVPDKPVDKPDLPADPNRTRRGQFTKGNTASRGNRGRSLHKQARLRAAILEAVTPERLNTMVGALMTKACAGEVNAARLVLEYAIGRPLPGDLLARISAIESAMDLSGDLDPEAIAAEGQVVKRTRIATMLYESIEAQGAEVDSQLAALDVIEQPTDGDDAE